MPVFDSTQLVIGDQTQYFFDDLVIETVENVRRTFHSPKRVGDEPVLEKDQPWEHITYFSCNTWQMIYDPKEALFKLWYVDWEKPPIKPGETAMGQSRFRILHAYSEDGLKWTA